MLKYVLVGALIVALLLSTYLGICINNSLQACIERNSNGSSYMARSFRISIGKASDIDYLLRTYREGYTETEPNVDNIEALIGGFFNEMEYSYIFLMGLSRLNPELSGYEKPLYFLDELIYYTIIGRESWTGGPTIHSILEHLLDQALIFHNHSVPLTAFQELNQTSFRRIDELGLEVGQSFAPFNATRLDNTINMVEELQNILVQWIDRYS